MQLMLITEEKSRKQRSEECLFLKLISEANPHFPLLARRLLLLLTLFAQARIGVF